MILFHGRRAANGVVENEVEVELTIKRHGDVLGSQCVIEMSARVVGDFSEHRSYLLYPQYCESLVRKGKFDDRKLNPDDLINRILPKLSFDLVYVNNQTSPSDSQVSTSSDHVESSAAGKSSDEQKSNSKTERKVVIKFEDSVPDAASWHFERAADTAASDAASNTSIILYTALRPDLDMIEKNSSNFDAIAAIEKVSPRAPKSLEPLSTTSSHVLPVQQNAETNGSGRTQLSQDLRPTNIITSAASSSGSAKVEGHESSVKSPRLAPLLQEGASIEEKLEETFENAQPHWTESDKKSKKSTLFGLACSTDGGKSMDDDNETESKKNANHVYDLYYTKSLQNSQTDPNLSKQVAEANMEFSSMEGNHADNESIQNTASTLQKETQHRRRRSSTDLPMIMEHSIMDGSVSGASVLTPKLQELSPLASPSGSSGKISLPDARGGTPQSRSRRYTSNDAAYLGRSGSGSGKYYSNSPAAMFLAANARAGDDATSGRIRAEMSSSRIMNRMDSQGSIRGNSVKRTPSGNVRLQPNDNSQRVKSPTNAKSPREEVRRDELGYIIDDFNSTSVTDSVAHRS